MEIIKSIMSSNIGNALVILPLSLLAKNLLGAGYGIQTNSFKSEYLKRGMYKGALVYASIAVVALVAKLSPELVVVVNETEMELIAAVAGTIQIYNLYVVGEFMVLLSKVFKVKKEEE